MTLVRPRRWSDWLALALLASFVTAGSVSVWWLSRSALAVHRLTRGIGDTVFYGADGQPWFRLDEQRHDVALSEISPSCSTRSWRSRTGASTTIPASIRSAWRARPCATSARGATSKAAAR